MFKKLIAKLATKNVILDRGGNYTPVSEDYKKRVMERNEHAAPPTPNVVMVKHGVYEREGATVSYHDNSGRLVWSMTFLNSHHARHLMADLDA